MLAKILKKVILHVQSDIGDLFPDPLLRKNRRFKNIHQGERCFILGSGHSIKDQDLTLLSGQTVMTQNHFHVHEQIKTINPKYHVVVPKYQPKEYDKDWVEWLTSMSQILPQDTTLFFGKNTKYLVDQLSLFPNRAFYMRDGYQCAFMRKAPVDITRTIMSVQTALLQCLAIALYMGFKEIILLGFDLDQVCRLGERSKIRFYGHSPITANKAEEKAEESTGASGIDWINMWIIWKQCNLLKRAAENRGIKIINATRGGLLNMFERRNYEELLKTNHV
jgi:hypothetical protein